MENFTTLFFNNAIWFNSCKIKTTLNELRVESVYVILRIPNEYESCVSYMKELLLVSFITVYHWTIYIIVPRWTALILAELTILAYEIKPLIKVYCGGFLFFFLYLFCFVLFYFNLIFWKQFSERWLCLYADCSSRFRNILLWWPWLFKTNSWTVNKVAPF
mgnify:CR=1 FL=1